MMNAKDITNDTQENTHTEYKDAQGNIHTKYKDTQGNLHSQYKDAQGNIHADYEYKDAKGNLHFDEDGYIDSQLAIEDIQDTREPIDDKNLSTGILIGVIITCVVGLSAGAIYFLTQQRDERPIYWMNGRMGEMYQRNRVPNPMSEQIREPMEQGSQTPSPTPEKVEVIEQPVATIVPVPQAQTPKPSATSPSSQQESINTAKPPTNRETSVSKPVVISPSNDSATTSNVSKTDSDLKKAILREFNNNLPNHQLTVEVKMVK